MTKYRIREHPEGEYTIEHQSKDCPYVWDTYTKFVPAAGGWCVLRVFTIADARAHIKAAKAEDARKAVNRIVWEEQS